MHAFKHAPHATQMMGNDGEKQVQNEQVTPSQDPQGLPEKKTDHQASISLRVWDIRT
jgi:hypothetical protein